MVNAQKNKDLRGKITRKSERNQYRLIYISLRVIMCRNRTKTSQMKIPLPGCNTKLKLFKYCMNDLSVTFSNKQSHVSNWKVMTYSKTLKSWSHNLNFLVILIFRQFLKAIGNINVQLLYLVENCLLWNLYKHVQMLLSLISLIGNYLRKWVCHIKLLQGFGAKWGNGFFHSVNYSVLASSCRKECPTPEMRGFHQVKVHFGVYFSSKRPSRNKGSDSKSYLYRNFATHDFKTDLCRSIFKVIDSASRLH